MRWSDRQLAMLREIGVRVFVREPVAEGTDAPVVIDKPAAPAPAALAPRAEAVPVRVAPAPDEATMPRAPAARPAATTAATPAAAADWLVVVDASATADAESDEARLLANMLRAIGVDTAAAPAARRAVIVEAGSGPLPSDAANPSGARIALAFGRAAAQALLGRDEPVGALRCRVHERHGLPVVVTLAPAYLLRQPDDKAKAWADLCLAAATLDAGRSA